VHPTPRHVRHFWTGYGRGAGNANRWVEALQRKVVMAKSKNRWDVIYETVDEQAHKIIPHFAASNVDYKTALMVKRNHKKICAMEIRPTQLATDAGSAVLSELVQASALSTPQTLSTPQRG
jgi:hypothetical protein